MNLVGPQTSHPLGQGNAHMTNLSLFVAESADMYPDSVALRSSETATTYSELHHRLRQLSGYLAEIGVQTARRYAVGRF